MHVRSESGEVQDDCPLMDGAYEPSPRPYRRGRVLCGFNTQHLAESLALVGRVSNGQVVLDGQLSNSRKYSQYLQHCPDGDCLWPGRIVDVARGNLSDMRNVKLPAGR